jgi:hypothetical protein
VTDSFINVTLATGLVITPDLQQLISHVERQQLIVDEPEMQDMLNTLETMMQRNAPDSLQHSLQVSNYWTFFFLMWVGCILLHGE